jgi:DNA-binding transcriptional MerR regulator
MPGQVVPRGTKGRRTVPTDGRTWTITELADEFGITLRTLRFYEEHGLLTPERRGTQRVFRPGDRVRLELVLRGKRLGFGGRDQEIVGMRHRAGRSRPAHYLLDQIAVHRCELEQRRADIEQTLGSSTYRRRPRRPRPTKPPAAWRWVVTISKVLIANRSEIAAGGARLSGQQDRQRRRLCRLRPRRTHVRMADEAYARAARPAPRPTSSSTNFESPSGQGRRHPGYSWPRTRRAGRLDAGLMDRAAAGGHRALGDRPRPPHRPARRRPAGRRYRRSRRRRGRRDRLRR